MKRTLKVARFKPLVASSLAMALGVSVASGAAQPVTCTSSSGAPAICVNNNNTDISNSQLQITWNGLMAEATISINPPLIVAPFLSQILLCSLGLMGQVETIMRKTL